MKLLISTYACAPGLGSEHAVGWNWTTAAHCQGHEVWAFASSTHRSAIETACRDDPDLAGIRWIFPEVPAWSLQPGTEPKWERTYNLLWQRMALRHARELTRQISFDAIHHLTWGGVRAPTFLGDLGAPLIVGPVGGGETSPRLLRDGFHFKARMTEAIRDLSNATIAINPVVRPGLTQAAVVFVKTSDTGRLLPRATRQKAVKFLELGLPLEKIAEPRNPSPQPAKLLYAGRLLYWKGVHIALLAFASLVRRLPRARLTIVGSGPELDRLKTTAAAYGLGETVEFVAWLPQSQLFQVYAEHDLFVFPSLHDSSGGVVLEAMARGLPVICLDLGGPKELVTAEAGVIVSTGGYNTGEVAAAVGDAALRLLTSPDRLAALSAGAIARAREFILSRKVRQFYDYAAQVVTAYKSAQLHGKGRLPQWTDP
jgi:glycosyltransferase involved in cell wall biosynthesis